ncbi:MAG: hypothetical protein L0H63_13645 [Nitrococcus sp.]|nr:hypothetical protein [Nitrococcus sp.]
MSPEIILIAVVILAVAAFVLHKRKKNEDTRDQGDEHDPTVPPADPPEQPEQPDPPPSQPETPADPVIVDRNGKRPGEPGYDPRIDRPADEFSPVEPVGSYFGEGPFDPDARWVGQDGVHNGG